MRKKTLSFLLVMSVAGFAHAATPDFFKDQEPLYTVVVAKTGKDGWSVSTIVSPATPNSKTSITVDGVTKEAIRTQGYAAYTAGKRSYLINCSQGKVETGSYDVGQIVTVIDDQLYVTDKKLIRMEKIQLPACVAWKPVLEIKQWSVALTTQTPSKINAPDGYEVTVELASK